MASFAHDAEVIVYNYTSRITDKADLSFFSIGSVDAMETEEISLKEAITNISCTKNKSSPQGSFSIVLKGTQDWTKIIVPGSWCAIYMSDSPLKEGSVNAGVDTEIVDATDGTSVTNVIAPLKMIGMIMAVRMQKSRTPDGTYIITYTLTGYDFGYAFTAQIYINHYYQPIVESSALLPSFQELYFPQNSDAYGDPVKNLNRVLSAWSTISNSPFTFATGTSDAIQAPSVGMTVPSGIGDLVGSGDSILQFIGTAVGLDKRDGKVINLADDGTTSDFEDKLIGDKQFNPWKIILQNSLWGMINEYLNPILNEAYCDLHPIAVTPVTATILGASTPTSMVMLKPMMIARQIPFSTPAFTDLWFESPPKDGSSPLSVTKFNKLPKTVISSEKIISYDIGYAEYERKNFLEINGFLLNGATNNKAALMSAYNPPMYREGSVNRFGLRPMIVMGADYGMAQNNQETASLWRPLLADWWFNVSRFANGTVECIGLSEHIALGENVEFLGENLLCHVEGYTHTFMIDGDGNRIFRTSIEFSKGIAADSTDSEFKYIYGDPTLGGTDSFSEDKGSFNQKDLKRITYKPK